MVKDKDGDTVATVCIAKPGTPEPAACSHHTVQWKMDIVFAYRNGLQYVLEAYLYTCYTQMNLRRLCRSPRSRNVRELLHHHSPHAITLNNHRGLHYHKIVQNEFYVSHCAMLSQDHVDNAPRATQMNGSHQCPRLSATATRSVRYLCSSSPSHQVWNKARTHGRLY